LQRFFCFSFDLKLIVNKNFGLIDNNWLFHYFPFKPIIEGYESFTETNFGFLEDWNTHKVQEHCYVIKTEQCNEDFNT